MHRIGRTGRAEREGQSILFYSEKETPLKDAIESLMKYTIPFNEFPEEVAISTELTPQEKEPTLDPLELSDRNPTIQTGAAFHEKSAKNNREKKAKVSYHQKLKAKYKKPIRRGDKIQNRKSKKKRK